VKRVRGGGGAMSKKRLREKRKLTLDIPSETPGYKLSPTGTFTEDDVKINQHGLVLTREPAQTSTAEEATEVETVDGANVLEEGGKKKGVWPWKRTKRFCVKHLDELEDTGDVIGTGSSGVVRKCIHARSGKAVAVKVIALDTDASARKHLLEELRTLYRSQHPAIVGFYGAFLLEGKVSIALEYMDCGTLASLVEKVGQLPEDVLARVAGQLLDGFVYIHEELHLVHRDIKPTNLLLNSEGHVKICDFGVVGKLQNTIGQAQTFAGTLTYMSPERVVGKPHSSSSDIWSLGLTLMECALGKYPYEISEGMTFFELLELVESGPAPELPLEFTPEAREFMRCCLQKDENDRPTARELRKHAFVQKHVQGNVQKWIKRALRS